MGYSTSRSATASWRRNTRLDADGSALVLADRIARRRPFIFIRYGDGFLECMNGVNHRTCDGEVYSPALGEELLRVWRLVVGASEAFVGDWLSASFKGEPEYVAEYASLVGDARPKWLHYETLLLMRSTTALKTFYAEVRDDPRAKLLMGPEAWRPAARILNTDFMPVPAHSIFDRHLPRLSEELEARTFDVLLYGAGMAGNIPVIDHWAAHRDRTYVNLGSALDPAYRGRTRLRQLSQFDARALLSSLPVRRWSRREDA